MFYAQYSIAVDNFVDYYLFREKEEDLYEAVDTGMIFTTKVKKTDSIFKAFVRGSIKLAIPLVGIALLAGAFIMTKRALSEAFTKVLTQGGLRFRIIDDGVPPLENGKLPPGIYLVRYIETGPVPSR